MRRVLAILIICLALAGCQGSAEATLYAPPTLEVSPLPPTVAASPQPASGIALTSTPSCTNQLTYLEDMSIQDGTNVQPGEALDKRWRVENSGTCNWDEHYQLRLFAGPDLGAAPEQALYPARSGTQANIRMLFTAPSQAGAYRSAWQAYDPQGQPFGDPIFIEIVVTQ
jgi:hypothetical protein